MLFGFGGKEGGRDSTCSWIWLFVRLLLLLEGTMIEGLVKPLRKRSHTFDGPTPEELPIFQKEIRRQLEDERAAQEADRSEKLSEVSVLKQRNTDWWRPFPLF